MEYFGKSLALGVGVIVEVEEQDQEDQPIKTDDVEEDGELVGTLLHEEELADVSRD